MGILKNPNDAKADKHDIIEAIRRNGGRAQLSNITGTLGISLPRAEELINEAINTKRVYKDTSEKDIYHNRF